MMAEQRLIDANAFLNSWHEWLHDDSDKRLFTHLIEDAPTIDAVEVVHGRWEVRDKIIVCAGEKGCYEALRWNFYVKDRCFEGKLPAYCPFCGAKMDGGADK